MRPAILFLVAFGLVACSGPGSAVTSTPRPATASGGPPTSTKPIAMPTDAASPKPLAATGTALPSPTPQQATPTETLTATPVVATVTSETATVTPEATEVESEADAGSKEVTTTAGLVSEIDVLVEGREGLYGVVVIDQDGEMVYSLNADRQMQSASLYKLLIMVEVFRQIEDDVIALNYPVVMNRGFFKEAGFDDPFDPSYIGTTVTVEELLRPLIALSSNVAAFALLDLVGNVNVNRTVAELGLAASEIRWMPALETGSLGLASYAGIFRQTSTEPAPTTDEAFNVTSAADMALLFRLLVEGRVVSAEASEVMLDLLAEQVVNDRLPALLPSGTIVTHKTGNIDNVIHDAGVIYTPSGPVVTAVLTEDALEWEAVEFMRELALLVYTSGPR
ncbi:N/A [soil metagenome]